MIVCTVTPIWYSGKRPYQTIENVSKVTYGPHPSLGVDCVRIDASGRHYYYDPRLTTIDFETITNANV